MDEMYFSHQIVDYLIIKLYFPKIIKKQSSFYDEIGKIIFHHAGEERLFSL